jgi:hypothetical protein
MNEPNLWNYFRCKKSDRKKFDNFLKKTSSFVSEGIVDFIAIRANHTFLDILYFFRSLVLCFFKYDKELQFSHKDWLSFCVRLKSIETLDFVPVAKFITAYPLAKYLKNQPPITPKCIEDSFPLLFEGKIRLWIKSRLCLQSSMFNHMRSLSLWVSVLQGCKRGCKTVPFQYVESSYKKHENAMKKDGSIYTPDMMVKFQDCAFDFCSGFTSKGPTLHSMSLNASLESSKLEGGASGYIKKESIYGHHKDNNYYYHNPDLSLDENNKLSNLNTIWKETRTFLHENGEVEFISGIPGFLMDEQYSISYLRREILNLHPELEYVKVNYELTEPIYRKFNWVPIQIVSVMAIREPLKVRMITKGESLPYYYAKFFQRETKSYLDRFPQFVLTNEKLQTKHLVDIILNKEVKLENKYLSLTDNGPDLGFDLFVSGDYSAATDNLKECYTKAAFEAFLEKYEPGPYTSEQLKNNEIDKNILRSVIYNARCSYPADKNDERGYYIIDQKNGQLMGSILSFPILCMVNLLTYKLALQEYLLRYYNYDREIPFCDLPVLVNGDDILFRANTVFYKIWLRWINEVGFDLSIGKNYVHQSFCSVNSVSFLYDGDSDFIEIGYLNCGLLIGSSKLSMKPAEENIPFHEFYNTVMRGLEPDEQLRFHKKFMFYHKKRVSLATNYSDFNLFASPFLGGLGFIKPDSVINYFTPFQRKLGYYLKSRLSNFFGTSSQLKNYIFRPLVTEPMVTIPRLSDPRKFKLLLMPRFRTLNRELYDGSLTMSSEEFFYSPYLLKNKIDIKSPDFWSEEDLYASDFEPLKILPPDYKSGEKILKGFRQLQHTDDIPLLEEEDMYQDYSLVINDSRLFSNNLPTTPHLQADAPTAYIPQNISNSYDVYMKVVDPYNLKDKESRIDLVELDFSNKLQDLENTQLTKELLINLNIDLSLESVDSGIPISINNDLINRRKTIIMLKNMLRKKKL